MISTQANKEVSPAVGQIEKIFDRTKRNGQPYKVFEIDVTAEREEKVRYSCFHASINQRVRAGDWVRYDWYQNGEWRNIDSLEIVREDGSVIWSFDDDRKGEGILTDKEVIDERLNGDAIKAVEDEGDRLTPDDYLILEVLTVLHDTLEENTKSNRELTAAICAAQGWSKLEAKRELEKMKGVLG